MSTTFCLSVRTECASDDNTTRTDFSHYFRSLAEVVLNTLHLTYKQASKSITTHGWWAEVGLAPCTSYVGANQIVPADAVAAIMEVKAVLNKSPLEEAFAKIEEVKRLKQRSARWIRRQPREGRRRRVRSE